MAVGFDVGRFDVSAENFRVVDDIFFVVVVGTAVVAIIFGELTFPDGVVAVIDNVDVNFVGFVLVVVFAAAFVLVAVTINIENVCVFDSKTD